MKNTNRRQSAKAIKNSGMASTAANRAQFIAWNINFIQTYGTDGVDLGTYLEKGYNICFSI